MSSNYGQLLKDLQVGFEEGEKPVSEFLHLEFGIITKNVGRSNTSWDLEVTGIDKRLINSWKKGINLDNVEKRFINKLGRTFEVKRDKASDRTDNFFYEVWSSFKVNNPGCVNYSKADTLVIVRSKEFIFINRGVLISWVIEHLFSNSELGTIWRKKTGKRINNPTMRTSRYNQDVCGILLPIKDIKSCPGVMVFERQISIKKKG